jgi:hypothetical protein
MLFFRESKPGGYLTSGQIIERKNLFPFKGINITISLGVDVYQILVIKNNISYLYRVSINTIKQPPMVITAYKTSKVNKYENPI